MILFRLRFLTWVFVTLFVIVDVRLAHLQFVARDFWVAEARSTQEGGEYVPFRRGALLDRFGKPIAVGEIEQTLNLHASDFRRETPIGLISGALRFLRDSCGRETATVPAVHEVVQQPEKWVRAFLGETKDSIGLLPQRLADDVKFYARRILDLSESEFRTAIDDFPSNRPLFELKEGGVERAVARIREQAAALDDLSKAIGVERAELLYLIEATIQRVESNIRARAETERVTFQDKKIRDFRRDYENRLQLLERGITYKAVFLVNMAPERFVGLVIRDVDARRYPTKYENLAPTLIGTVGAATPDVCEITHQHELRLRELESRDPNEIDDEDVVEIDQLRRAIRHEDYLPEEQLGRDGLEAVLEPVLRGHRGWKRVKRDRSQNDIEYLGGLGAIDGQDVRLTLDADLQLATQRILDKAPYDGAIVLIDPKDGAIRAMASRPNPTREQLNEDYGKLIEDPRNPLYHRAYRLAGNPPPPGSVFKLIVAAAGLENGTLGEYTTLDCARHYEVYGKKLKCLGAHPGIDLKMALAKSCNIFFYKTAPGVGYSNIIDMARRFGLGATSGFGDPKFLGLAGESKSIGEMAFNLPPKSESSLYVLQTAIGHGAIDDITPLQVATMIAPFANYGNRVTPYLVDRIGENEAPRKPPAKIGLKVSTVDIVRRAMEMVCDPEGTAHPRGAMDLRIFKVAGKSGTPQSVERGKEVDHAWFAGYFPHDHPKLVFAIIQQNTEHGGATTCAPILYELLSQPELGPYLQ